MEPHRQTTDNDFVGKWMAIAEPVRERVLRDLPHRSPAARDKACELASILHSLDNLLTYPWITQRVEEGSLTLHGWYFDIDHGALLAYSARRQQFLPLVRSLNQPGGEAAVTATHGIAVARRDEPPPVVPEEGR